MFREISSRVGACRSNVGDEGFQATCERRQLSVFMEIHLVQDRHRGGVNVVQYFPHCDINVRYRSVSDEPRSGKKKIKGILSIT
jgi:hypothetical protein